MAIDFSKWTEADTNLVDSGQVTMEELEAYNANGSTTPSAIVSLKGAGIGPNQDVFGQDMTAPGYQDQAAGWAQRGYDAMASDPRFEADRQRMAQEASVNATNDRYKSDLSWLNPEFQTNPAYVGQSAGSQVYANPADVAAQQQVYNQFGGYVGRDMGFESSARQEAQYDNWGGVAAGQGAPVFMGNGQQQGLVNDIGNLQGPQWKSDAQQQDVYNQIQSIQDPRFESADRQESVYNQIQNIKNPVFRSSADQESVMNDLGSIAKSGGAQGLNFDDGARQEEQYGHMKEIIDNGGLTMAERAARQKARADEEQWIRGQREADQQQFEQRGMAGSGQHVLALGQDRQAAAGRISMADLQAAADAEQRKLATIGMASSAAGEMRDDTFNEQSFMASRGDSALVNKGIMANQLRGDAYREGMGTTDTELRRAGMAGDMANNLRQSQYQESMGTASVQLQRAGLAGDMANSMRDDQYQEQAYQTGYELDKVNSQAQIVGQMRSQDYTERSYNDQRILEGMRQQTNLANTLRSDQFNESVAQRNSDYTALNGMGTMATNMRNASSQEAQFRASSTDHFTQLNQSAYNNAELANKSFMQDAWQSMMNNRQDWEMNALNQGIGVATGKRQADARENVTQFGAASGLAGGAANAWTDADARAKGAKIAAATGGNNQVTGANMAYNTTFGTGVGQIYGAFGDTMMSAAGGGAPTGGAKPAAGGGGAAPAAGGAAQPPPGGAIIDPWAPTNANRVY